MRKPAIFLVKLNLLTVVVFFVLTTLSIHLLFPSKIYSATYDLTTEYNLRIDGAQASDYLGYPTLNYYDVDNNGIDDLVLYKYGNPDSIYIIFDSLINDDLLNIGSTAVIGSSLNYSVRITGFQYSASYKFEDINGDNKMDLITSSQENDEGGRSNNGAIYIIDGNTLISQAVGTTFSATDSNYWMYRIYGAGNSHYLRLNEVEDFDNDNLPDIIAGAEGADYNGSNNGSVYLISNEIITSQPEGADFDLATSTNFTVRYDAEHNSSWAGNGLASGSLLDINNDGYKEILMSYSQMGYLGTQATGGAYLINGTDIPTGSVGNTVDLADANAYSFIIGWTGYRQFMSAVPFHTGTNDGILVTAYTTDSYYYFSPDYLAEYLDNDKDAIEPTSGQFTLNIRGTNLLRKLSVEDYNNDGKNDALLSDTFADENGNDTGIVYLTDSSIYSSYTGIGNTANIENVYKFKYLGDSSNTTYISQPAFHSGDINNDGMNDFLFGTDWTAYNGSRSGSVWVVLNYPHTISLSTSLNPYSIESIHVIEGSIVASQSVMNIGGAQWSLNNDPLGSWTECTSDDGSFDSTAESFTCNVNFGNNGIQTVYVRSYDENGSYTAVNNYATVGTIIDTNKPDDSYENTDFEIEKIDGNSIDDNGAKNQEGQDIGKGISYSKKPKIEFAKIGDDLSGVNTYEIRLTKTHEGLDTRDGNDYKWIDDIPHEGNEGEERERDGAEINYKGNKIKVKPKDDKYKLDKGVYYMKIRACDNANNCTDSDEVKMEIKSEEESNNESEDYSNSDQSEITLENIGTISYDSNYSTYYYTAHNITFSGTGTEGNVVLKINDEEASNAKTIDGRFSIGSTLSTGSHKIEINGIVFSLVVDPTRESFPESLK